MTVYVDPPAMHGNLAWSHMMTDQDDLTELHEMAEKIGLKRKWFQDNPDHPHYDVRLSKRAKAIRFGAIECDRNKIVEIIRARRARLKQEQL